MPCFSPAPATPWTATCFPSRSHISGRRLWWLPDMPPSAHRRPVGAQNRILQKLSPFRYRKTFFVVRIAGFVIRCPAFHLYARPSGRFFLTFPGIGAYTAYKSRICWFNEPSACGCALNGSGVCFCYFIKNKSAPIRHKDFMSLVEFVQSRKENAAVLFR